MNDENWKQFLRAQDKHLEPPEQEEPDSQCPRCGIECFSDELALPESHKYHEKICFDCREEVEELHE